MRGDTPGRARQAGTWDTRIPEPDDELGLRRLVRQAIERVQAQDISDAEKRTWIA